MTPHVLEGCLILAGATATGKSEIALRVAQAADGEIVSVDSMQVYRGLDIGTAKPSLEERAGVPHHVLDVAEVTQSFDAAQFVELAKPAIEGIRDRGKVPILCGGTGLYFKALLSGLGKTPPSETRLRAELEVTPLTNLLRELQAKDPVAFERIDRNNPRRVIRAVEVIRLSGRPFSSQRAEWTRAAAAAPGMWFGLSRSPEDLRQRINARVEAMFRRGLVAETAKLLELGLDRNRTASLALGYRQVIGHLRGERPLPQTIELVKTRTWQFAKRQMTWFRGQLALNWIPLQPQQDFEPIIAKLAQAGKTT